MSAVPNHSESSCGSASEAYRVAWASSAEIPKCANTIPNAINAMSVRIGEEPEQPVKLPHLRNLGSPAYLELSGTMVGRAGLNLWRGSRVLFCQKKKRGGGVEPLLSPNSPPLQL